MKEILKYTLLSLTLSFYSCTKEKKTAEITKNKPVIEVGVFNGNGAGAVSVIETIEALKIDTEIKAYPVSSSDIMSGKLDELDVLIFPGGSGSKQLNNLGKLGKEKVTSFVHKEGKGIIGICAGAYMLCSTEGYPSLQIAGVKHIDRPHYDRGRGLVAFKIGKKGEAIFPELKEKNQFLQYYDGPVIESLDRSKNYTEIAQYVTDIHPHEGYPQGITPGKVFMYTEKIGKGKVFGIAGHAESTPGMRWMIPRMARWVSNKALVSYDNKWVKPNQYTQALLFDKSLSKKEKKLWWQLADTDSQKQIAAMDSLYLIHSRPAVRWNIGLLRDLNPQIRAHAADLIAKTEYSDAIKDLEVAFSMEKDSLTKQNIQKALYFFKK